MQAPISKEMAREKTACAGCEHYSTHTVVSMGTCMHKDGPLRVWSLKFWAGDGYYPPGCPINPDPPTPPRKRPGKKRGPKPGPKYNKGEE